MTIDFCLSLMEAMRERYTCLIRSEISDVACWSFVSSGVCFGGEEAALKFTGMGKGNESASTVVFFFLNVKFSDGNRRAEAGHMFALCALKIGFCKFGAG